MRLSSERWMQMGVLGARPDMVGQDACRAWRDCWCRSMPVISLTKDQSAQVRLPTAVSNRWVLRSRALRARFPGMMPLAWQRFRMQSLHFSVWHVIRHLGGNGLQDLFDIAIVYSALLSERPALHGRVMLQKGPPCYDSSFGNEHRPVL